MEDVLNLEVCSDDSTTDVLTGIEYPCLVIDGVTSEEEIFFFRDRSVGSDATLPLYCVIENVPLKIGTCELELKALLSLKGIFDYKLTLYKSAEHRIDLDLNDPSVLMKFIRL